MEKLIGRNIHSEIKYQTSRSSGPGGQHVNKVSSRVEAYLDIQNSVILSEKEIDRIQEKLSHRIDKKGVLRVYDQSTRSQHRNKEKAALKLIELVFKALQKRKRRIPTKISAKKRQEIVKAKRRRSMVKKMRGAVKGTDF